ncbi:HEAT repeat domain-containing protein [Hwangdonia sp.]|uniref:HEAT repeat domain-containing protein n=1 Tax=Hwangdonia sp. TaxID=1883432 RepID=UPI003AB7AD33
MDSLNYIFNYIEDFPFLVKSTLWFSGILALLIIILILYLRLIRLHLRIKDNEIKTLKSEYETLLVEYLYSGSSTEHLTENQLSIISRLKKEATIKSRRKIIVLILYKLMSEVSGEMSEAAKIFYFKTGLFEFALKGLKTKKWHIISKAIGELRRFQVVEIQNEIMPLITHPVREVRKEAHLYFVSLFQFDGLMFLNKIKTPLSEWDQLQILGILQRFDKQDICDIKPWLKSSNHTVVLFALKLAKVYNQFEVKDVLIDLLSHENQDIRICTIEVLTSLYGIEAKEVLKTNFNELSIEEQLCFFEMLEKLVVPTDEPFIEKHLFHKDFEIQLLALKILKSINLDKFLGLKELATNKDKFDMYKFVNNG